MSLRRTIVLVGCVALILGSALIWHFVHFELNNRQLAKDATASRIRAEQGDAEAQFKLGSIYSKGKGVRADFVEAARWYRKSAGSTAMTGPLYQLPRNDCCSQRLR